jgi:arginine decarboxylase
MVTIETPIPSATTVTAPLAETATPRDIELHALLRGPALAESVAQASAGLVAWCTPSLRPGLRDPLELSVSTAAIRTADGEPLGEPGSATGPFGRAARLAALAYGADHAVLGVNGSSGLNHTIARVLACAERPHVLLPMNAHHSLLDALSDLGVAFSRAGATYASALEAMMPPTPADIERALGQTPSPVTAIVLSSPTYEGVHADLGAIAAIARRIGAVLVVDAAWGAHGPFLPGGGPIAPGADLAVTSLHKTAGARQQAAVLLHRDGRVAWDDVRMSCSPVTTTSPSYPLLCDIDASIRWLLTDGGLALDETARRVARFAAQLRSRYPQLEVMGATPAIDPLRVTLGGLDRVGLTGYALAQRLASRRIAVEKRGRLGLTFLAPLQLSDADVERTLAALGDALAGVPAGGTLTCAAGADPFADAALTPVVSSTECRLAVAAGRVEAVALDDAVGRVCAQRVELYPPGIPLLLPGFRVTAGAASAISDGAAHGAGVASTARAWDGSVLVLSDVL